jgi:hypothetical protein
VGTGTTNGDVTGTAGDDSLYVSESGVSVRGGKGDDTFTHDKGETGQTYRYASGDGNDTLRLTTASGRSDTLDLDDLKPGDVTIKRVGNDLVVVDKTTGQAITVAGQWADSAGTQGIASLRFSDGSSLDAAGITKAAEATAIAVYSYTGTAGDDTFQSTAADETFAGGLGADVYAFAPASGRDVISDFQATGSGHDLLQFDHAIFADAAHALAAASQVGDDTVIALSPTDQVTLKNTSLASLTAADIRIA